MTTRECFVERRMVATSFDGDDDPKPRPLQIDVSLAVEKEMTIALTGKSVRPGKIVQRVSDRISLVTQEGSSKVETLYHYKCSECDRLFMSSAKFKLHCRNVHQITHPYKCTLCDKYFTQEVSMKVHLRTHKNLKPFVCEQCGHSFAQRSTWVAHMVRHSGATPHICNECGKAFATKGDLSTHAWCHRLDKPFTCAECGASFSRKSNFARHMRKHTGEKPYKCAYCARTFARIETCREHENVHTKEKPYVCELCGAAFSNSGNFSKHKRSHMVDRAAAGKKTLSRKLSKLKADITDQSIDLQIVNTAITAEDYTTTIVQLTQNHDQVEQKAIVKRKEIATLPQPLKDVDSQMLLGVNKPIQVTLTNMIEPRLEPTTTKTGKGVNNDTSSAVDCTSLNSTFEPLKLPSYQFSSSLYNSPLPLPPPPQPSVPVSQPPMTSYLLTDLNFPQSSLSMNSNQTFMMMDYYQRADSTFSFASDGSLVVQQNAFTPLPQQTQPSSLHNGDGSTSFVYRSSDEATAPPDNTLNPADLQQDHTASTDGEGDLTCDLPSDHHLRLLNDSISPTIFPTGSVVGDGICDDYGDGLLDMDKFLNEQYLMKKSDSDSTGGVELDHDKDNSLSNLISGMTDDVYP